MQILTDSLAVEEPLEIKLGFDRSGDYIRRSISITMRTPGQDFDLAAGFLLTEGIITDYEQIADISETTAADGKNTPGQSICVSLKPGVPVELKRLERHFYTSSSCGVCGKASLEALNLAGLKAPPSSGLTLDAEIINGLPLVLQEHQSAFRATGGLHAAALFDEIGSLLELREDVGRHNAVDKVIGSQLRKNLLPLNKYILLVSGRTSFEILQKSLAGGIAMVAGVGAPSSLAVEVACAFNLTLIGFLRNGRFNLYSGSQRITHEGSQGRQCSQTKTQGAPAS